MKAAVVGEGDGTPGTTITTAIILGTARKIMDSTMTEMPSDCVHVPASYGEASLIEGSARRLG